MTCRYCADTGLCLYTAAGCGHEPVENSSGHPDADECRECNTVICEYCDEPLQAEDADTHDGERYHPGCLDTLRERQEERSQREHYGA